MDINKEQIERFIEMTAKMRHLQKEFFKTRNSAILQNAKKVEKEVDLQLAFWGKNVVNSEQWRLF